MKWKRQRNCEKRLRRWFFILHFWKSIIHFVSVMQNTFEPNVKFFKVKALSDNHSRIVFVFWRNSYFWIYWNWNSVDLWEERNLLLQSESLLKSCKVTKLACYQIVDYQIEVTKESGYQIVGYQTLGYHIVGLPYCRLPNCWLPLW